MKFSSIVGEIKNYDKVFIHLFSPLMYRWVATRKFNELNWMVWGTDLYNLPSLKVNLYNELTLNKYVRKDWSVEYLLYLIKVSFANAPFRDKAYAQVKNVLTWLTSEYQFARKHLPALQAEHQFFFYENQSSYRKLDELTEGKSTEGNFIPTIILGNAASPALNHLDAIYYFQTNKISANILVPISYGEKRYANFLKKNVSFYTYGQINFIDTFMDFNNYLNFLHSADGLVMYNRRPQGYGNILMMLYLGKPVFLHDQNISLPDLDSYGVQWHSLSDFPDVMNGDRNNSINKQIVLQMLSHERLLQSYQRLF